MIDLKQSMRMSAISITVFHENTKIGNFTFSCCSKGKKLMLPANFEQMASNNSR